MTETELEPCFLPPSKLCYSICSVSAPVSWSLSAKKTALSYGTHAGHWLWVKGHRPSDHFLPSSISFATFLSCTSCAISPSLASYPNLLPYPHALSPDVSPDYSFLGWLFLLGIPKAATGSKVVNETLAEENHLSQPQSSTESLKARSLKQQVWNYQDQTDLAKGHNSSRLSWISRVAKALLPNFMLFLQSMGPLGLSKDVVVILFNVRETYTCWRAKAFWLKFLYTVWDNSWYKHTCITCIQL